MKDSSPHPRRPSGPQPLPLVSATAEVRAAFATRPRNLTVRTIADGLGIKHPQVFDLVHHQMPASPLNLGRLALLATILGLSPEVQPFEFDDATVQAERARMAAAALCYWMLRAEKKQ